MPRAADQRITSTAASPVSAAAMERSLLMNVARGELILVRHGHQDYPDSAVPRAELVDPPLSEIGRQQADLVAAHLRHEPLSAVYCSPLQRAQATARAIVGATDGPEPVIAEDLTEIEIFGESPLELGVVASMEAIGGEVLDRACQEFLRTRRFDAFPHTESSERFRRRVGGAIRRLTQQHNSEPIVVVAHGGVINCFLAHIFGIDSDMFCFPAHASITRVFFDDERWALFTLNELAHLEIAGAHFVTY
jgi:probable phosphoglycerate mutase